MPASSSSRSTSRRSGSSSWLISSAAISDHRPVIERTITRIASRCSSEDGSFRNARRS